MKFCYFLSIALGLLSCFDSNAQVNRSYDGSHNNLVNPEWGSAGSHFRNFLQPAYSDGISEPNGQDRPNPRTVSNQVFGEEALVPSNMFLTDFAWTFGQFIDHDITLNDDNFSEFIPIEIPECDSRFDPLCTGEVMIPMRRSKSDTLTGTNIQNPRKHINDITHWIDGSGVYGSEKERADWLRTFEGGKLKTSEGNFLPLNTFDGEFASEVDTLSPFMLIEGDAPIRHFIAGDIRANEQPTLCSLHTLFVREHNRLCDELIETHPEMTDEELYQKARKMVSGIIQAITYEEWLPSMGIELEPYTHYQPDIYPNIMNVFSAAAFRLGHSLVNEQIVRLDENGNSISFGTMNLKDAFFNPLIILDEGGVDPFFRGLGSQMQQTFDTKIVDALRNFLFGPPGAGGLDLVSLNIGRGRERGLPDYNSIREAFGLPVKTSFDEITSNPDLAHALETVYNGDINNIDPWAGMLSEDMMPHVAVGELVMTIMQRQFQNLRDGDRFYYESDYALTEDEKEIIKNTRLGDVIKRNSDVEYMQENVFLMGDHQTGIEMGGFENIKSVDIQAYPNPVVRYFTVNLYSLEAEKATFTVTDVNGKTLFAEELQVQSGYNDFEFELEENLPSGVYIMYLETLDSQGSLKIIKQ